MQMQVKVTPGLNPCKATVNITFDTISFHGEVEVPDASLLTKLTLTEIEQVDGGLEYLMARFGVLIGSGRQPIAYTIPVKLTKTLVVRPG